MPRSQAAFSSTAPAACRPGRARRTSSTTSARPRCCAAAPGRPSTAAASAPSLRARLRRTMRYVVTGGSGYIGTRLVKALGERSDTERVLIVDLQPPRAFPSDVDCMSVDVRDAGRVQAALQREKADVVVHLAGLIDGERERMYETNVAGTNNVLDAAAKTGIRHVIAVSSAAAYGPRRNGGRPVDEESTLVPAQDFEYGRHAV